MIPGAAPVLLAFETRIAWVCCDGQALWCVVCDGTGYIDTLDFIDREDVEPVKFLVDA